MKVNRWLQENKLFVFLLLAALFSRLILFFSYHEIWWDSGVYVGMGKYVWSLGSAGLWEHIRPVLWPFVLGFFWFINLDPVIIGRILELLLSLGCIALVYMIGSELYNKRVGLVSSILFAFSSIFFYIGFHIYTEIPSLFFVLLGLFVFLRKRYYLSGIFTGLAFLAKFPSGMFIVVFGLAVLCLKDKFRNKIIDIAYLALGLLTILIPFLITNYFFYGSAFQPLIDARHTILNVLGCNYLRAQPWYYYFKIAFVDNLLNIFAVWGLFVFFKKINRKNIILLFALIIPLIYFTQMHCRDYRYFVLFVPFIAYFSALGLVAGFEFFRDKRKTIFFIFILTILILSMWWSLLFYVGNETEVYSDARIEYFKFLEDQKVEGEVWSSNPTISVYTDNNVDKIYYTVYDKGVATEFFDYLQKNHEKIDYVFLDNCGGGIICHPEDMVCLDKTDKMIDFLNENYEVVYNETQGRCYYLVYG